MSTKTKINGILLLDKPLGLSSNTALQKVKRIYNAVKAGHTGTLDPLATGLLPICLGEATKFSSFLLDADKEYIATIKLGVTTTTYDREGDIVETCEVKATKAEIQEAVMNFLGEVTQTPPIYSALKVNGKPLYSYARSGQEVAIKSRNITIYELDILEFIDNETFSLRVLCSKGTYIRSLAYDIGQKLGCGAHLYGLIRSKSSGFKLEDAITLEQLGVYSQDELMNKLLHVDSCVLNLPRINLTEAEYALIKNGCSFTKPGLNLAVDSKVRIYYQDSFLGLVTITSLVIKPMRLVDTSVMKLPIGISALEEIATKGYLYIDKTLHVVNLAE